MREVRIYAAFDGTRFDTADECRAHEASNIESRLIGLTAEQLAAAVARTDTELGDAIEQVAGRIARARREAGDLKRRPRAESALRETLPPALGPSTDEPVPQENQER